MSSKPKVKEVPVSNAKAEAEGLSVSSMRVNNIDLYLNGGFNGAVLLHSKYRSQAPVLDFAENVLGIQKNIANLQDLCYTLSKNAGWHPQYLTPGDIDNEQFCVKLALIHSELSEALEGQRRDKQDEHLPHRKSVEVELADALIRIMDLGGARGLDLSGAVIDKLLYNQRREDHKLEARGEANGKRF